MSTMTLEQARDLLASYLDDRGCHIEAENVRKGIDLESYENELKLVGWMYRHTHLSQPARAVDMSHVHKLIAQYWELAYAEGKEGRTTDTAAGDAQRVLSEITRALSGEKAGLAGEWEAAFHAQRAAAMRSHTVCYETMLAHPEVAELGDDGRLHDAIHNILRVDGPASPAPDKEGQS